MPKESGKIRGVTRKSSNRFRTTGLLGSLYDIHFFVVRVSLGSLCCSFIEPSSVLKLLFEFLKNLKHTAKIKSKREKKVEFSQHLDG